MNRIDKLFKEKQGNILSIYFTAGHPTLQSTALVIEELEKNGVDLIEIGMPFSDPLADGPVIQKSSQKALENGMSLNLLFQQLKDIRKKVDIPLILMGYINPVLQYGIEKFCKTCAQIGIDGLILPDLPLDLYHAEYKELFEVNNIHYISLITPQTSNSRIQQIDEQTSGFIYMVSTASTTGARGSFSNKQLEYFERIRSMDIQNPRLIGFGISNRESYVEACKYSQGVIIGSAFVTLLENSQGDIKQTIKKFVKSILG